ncbi:MAG: nucleotidyltransferase domain-containing protein [Firmicutes bacterium]|nr:nucleotidyltransferase domain-containing protein [Bacillota bacterium]
MYKEKRLLTAAEKKRVRSVLKRELSRRKEVVFAYLHGSFLMQVPCGDIDLAVYLEGAALKREHWEYEAGLAMLLDPLAGMPVDVLTLNCAPVALRYHATCGKVLLSKNEPVRFTFLEETWREYFDCQPMFRAFYNGLLN